MFPGPGGALFAPCILFAAILAVAPAGRAANVYGQVEFVEGPVQIVNAGGQSRGARVGETVLEGESMVTGANGELHVRTDDRGLVALRPGTRIKVEIYRAMGDAEDRTVLSLVAGTLRTISGWIGRYQPHNYQLRTPNATIGIRGTDHEPLYVPPGEKSPVAAGTYDKVNSGLTFIETPAGRVFIDPNRAGFAPHEGNAAPELLDKVPAVYRPTKNEERIRKRKEELSKEMDQARLERQKVTAAKLDRSEKAEASGKTDKTEATDKSSKSDSAEKSDTKMEKDEGTKEAPGKKAAERRRRPAGSK